MSPISTAKMTAQQYRLLGEDPPGLRLELVDGEVAVSPSPRPLHSIVEKRLSRILYNYILEKGLGELLGDVDTVFGPHDVRRPDIIYFAKERLHLLGEEVIEAPPDLCVEILSPSSRTIDRKDKFKQYQGAGVAHYWMVDPEARSLEGYALRGRKYQLAGKGKSNQTLHLPPFPELAIPLAEIWWPAKR